MDNIKVRKAPLLNKAPFTVNLFFDGKPEIPPAEEIIKTVKEIVGDVAVRSSNESFSSFVCVGRDYEIEHNGKNSRSTRTLRYSQRPFPQMKES